MILCQFKTSYFAYFCFKNCDRCIDKYKIIYFYDFSRLSGGSTQSEIVHEKKKKTGLLGKLKNLTKSRSIDDGGSEFAGGMNQVTIQ